MTLLLSKINCSPFLEEVHIFQKSSLPDHGETISIPSSCLDSGSCVFTVNTYGVSHFILNNTCDIFLTINAFETSVNAFSLTHLSGRSNRSAQRKQHFNRNSGSFCTKAGLQRRTVLRLWKSACIFCTVKNENGSDKNTIWVFPRLATAGGRIPVVFLCL